MCLPEFALAGVIPAKAGIQALYEYYVQFFRQFFTVGATPNGCPNLSRGCPDSLCHPERSAAFSPERSRTGKSKDLVDEQSKPPFCPEFVTWLPRICHVVARICHVVARICHVVA